MDRSDEYRRRAAECQRMAAESSLEKDRAEWLRLAQSWMRLVHTAHRSGSSDAFHARAHALRTGQSGEESSH
jgi:hypothetical protein